MKNKRGDLIIIYENRREFYKNMKEKKKCKECGMEIPPYHDVNMGENKNGKVCDSCYAYGSTK